MRIIEAQHETEKKMLTILATLTIIAYTMTRVFISPLINA